MPRPDDTSSVNGQHAVQPNARSIRARCLLSCQNGGMAVSPRQRSHHRGVTESIIGPGETGDGWWRRGGSRRGGRCAWGRCDWGAVPGGRVRRGVDRGLRHLGVFGCPGRARVAACRRIRPCGWRGLRYVGFPGRLRPRVAASCAQGRELRRPVRRAANCGALCEGPVADVVASPGRLDVPGPAPVALPYCRSLLPGQAALGVRRWAHRIALPEVRQGNGSRWCRGRAGWGRCGLFCRVRRTAGFRRASARPLHNCRRRYRCGC